MTQEQAISKARHFAQQHGITLGSISIVELLTPDSPVVIKFSDRFGSHIGSWWLVFDPVVPSFDGREEFFINRASGKIEWYGKPFWFRAILKINHAIRGMKSRPSRPDLKNDP